MLSTLLVVGCSKSAVPEVQQPQPITFTTSMADATRGIDADLQVSGARLYGYCHTSKITDANVKDAKHLFLNEKINPDGTYAGTIRYWTQDARDLYFFYAYNDVSTVTPSGTTAMPLVNFTQHDKPTEMTDLVIADAMESLNPTGYVLPTINMFFRHALSKVKINFYNSKGTQLSSCNTTVRYAPNTVAKSASFALSGTNVTPVAGSFHDGTHPLKSNFVITTDAKTPSYAVNGGELMFVPQTILRTSSVLLFVVDLSYIVSGTTEVRRATTGIPIGVTETVLRRGYILNYYVDIDVESTAMQITGVTLTDWNRVDAPPVDWSEY